jgi:TRAP-type uncharacterized transport system substrate-binding protein
MKFTIAGGICATVAAFGLTLAVSNPVAAQEVRELRWATSSVGSSGHRAKVNLMAVLNREWEGYNINVLPTAGAIATIRGFTTGEFDGYYGADIAFQELANDTGRFTGFAERVERPPVQSFWAYTMEVGLAVRADEHASMTGWRDLAGQPVFTGPAPWDVRAALENALNVLEVGHTYRELDLGLAGSSLNQGTISGFIAYTAGESALAPWVQEAEMAADIAVLSPSEAEIAELQAAGLDVVAISSSVFQTELGVDEVYFVPFFYGFHLGTDVPEEDLYAMLLAIETHAEELAASDAVFAQLAADMPELQRRGVQSAVQWAEIHPGLARYLRERDAWDSAWDERVAQ